MTKQVELRRHTDADGDALSDDGVRAALDIAVGLDSDYELCVSSGAQRATQTIACLLAGLGQPVPGGVVVDDRFRSAVEDRWKAAYETAGSGDLRSLEQADPELVGQETSALGDALRAVFERLTPEARGLVVGHSPMQEAAVYGLTGTIVEPLSKGAGVLVTELNEGTYRVDLLP
ncbi:hypothetical protein BH18ACT15_BH18ACT15_11610 [soil metagenome]